MDSQPSDNVLAERAAAGDEQAFATLVRRHKDRLYRLLRRYTDDADEAYEAVHEAFIAAWGAFKRYDPNRSFGAWLRTIAINKARDRGRRMMVRRLFFGTRGLDDAEALATPDPADSAETCVLQEEAAARLGRAIARLPAPLKAALLLTAFEGMSQQEAADVLRVSVKTVETRVYRARKLLTKDLAPDLNPSVR